MTEVVPTPSTNPADPTAPVTTTTPPASTTPPANQPAPTTTPAATTEPITLTDEQWKAAYESDRFKQLNAEAKKAKDLQKQIDDAEEKRLKESGDWQKVAETKDQQLSSMQTNLVNAEIKAEAAKLGATNPSIVATAIDRANVKVETDGSITGVAEAVEALKVSDPYLFNNPTTTTTTRVGSPTNPGAPTNGGYQFTMSQIKDPVFYRANAAAIKLAVAQGKVDRDK